MNLHIKSILLGILLLLPCFLKSQYLGLSFNLNQSFLQSWQKSEYGASTVNNPKLLFGFGVNYRQAVNKKLAVIAAFALYNTRYSANHNMDFPDSAEVTVKTSPGFTFYHLSLMAEYVIYTYKNKFDFNLLGGVKAGLYENTFLRGDIHARTHYAGNFQYLDSTAFSGQKYIYPILSVGAGIGFNYGRGRRIHFGVTYDISFMNTPGVEPKYRLNQHQYGGKVFNPKMNYLNINLSFFLFKAYKSKAEKAVKKS